MLSPSLAATQSDKKPKPSPQIALSSGVRKVSATIAPRGNMLREGVGQVPSFAVRHRGIAARAGCRLKKLRLRRRFIMEAERKRVAEILCAIESCATTR